MLQCCTRIRSEVAAAARRFGVADPLSAGGGFFARTLERAAAHPECRSNSLQPGALPFEWSFSESEPDALRIEIEPLDPDLGPAERLRWSAAGVAAAVREIYGDARATEFEAAAQQCESRSQLRFGAFVGVSVAQRRSPRFKLYVEERGDGWPARCLAVAAAARATAHFRSVTAAADGIAGRHYFLCRDGLRLRDLESVCDGLGIAHRAAPLILTMAELSGGEFYLPPRSAVLAMRVSPEPELKVEWFSGKLASGRFRRLLEPDHLPSFDGWTRLTGSAPNVLSVKVSRAAGVSLSCYAPGPEEEP